jgi:NADH-quinone oxidoreductase subunit F
MLSEEKLNSFKSIEEIRCGKSDLGEGKVNFNSIMEVLANSDDPRSEPLFKCINEGHNQALNRIAVPINPNEPGDYVDSTLIRSDPVAVMEGAILFGKLVNAQEVVFFVSSGFDRLKGPLEAAIENLKKVSVGGVGDIKIGLSGGGGGTLVDGNSGVVSALTEGISVPFLKQEKQSWFFSRDAFWATLTVEECLLTRQIVKEGRFPSEFILSVCGQVQDPKLVKVKGCDPLTKVIEAAGGMLRDATPKAVVFTRNRVPVLTYDTIWGESPVISDCLKGGSRLGSRGVVVLGDGHCMVELSEAIISAARRGNCGHCAPGREGYGWLLKVINSLLKGEGRIQDVDLLERISGNLAGKGVCDYCDFPAITLMNIVQNFRDEFEYFVREGRSKVTGGKWDAVLHS